MSLPVSPEYPVVPYQQFAPGHPPCIPALNVVRELQPYIPLFASAVANEASDKASYHAARMFCYNLISANNWRNNDYVEAVELAANLCNLDVKKGIINSIETGINNAAASALSFYSSRLIYQYPELKSMIAPNILNAAHQNVQLLNDLINQITNMNNSYPVPQMQPPYQGGHPAHMDPRYSMPPQYSGGHQMYPGQHPQQQFHGHQPMHSNYPQPMHQGGTYHHHSQQPQGAMGQGGSWASSGISTARINGPGVVVESIAEDRFLARRANRQQYVAQPIQQPVQIEQVEIPLPKAKVKNMPKYLMIDGGSEVDRSKHQLTYFDQSFPVDMDLRTRQYRDEAEELGNSIITPDNLVNTPILHADPVWVTNGADAVMMVRSVQNESRDINKPLGSFRCFIATNESLYAFEEMSDYMVGIKKCSDFNTLAVRIKSLSTSLSTVDRNATDAVLPFLKSFENLLTQKVNDFLKYRLKLEITISEYTSDIKELFRYFQDPTKKYGLAYVKAMDILENQLINFVTATVSDELLEEHPVKSVDLYGYFFNSMHSYTMIPLTDKELGFKDVDYDPLIIDKDRSPTLYKLAISLSRHKAETGYDTFYDYLVTSDNVKYRIHESALIEGEYYISK